MRTLPFDCYRCKPTYPADKCKECLRYRDMPDQTWGPRTPLMALVTPDGEGCDFISFYLEKDKHESN